MNARHLSACAAFSALCAVPFGAAAHALTPQDTTRTFHRSAPACLRTLSRIDFSRPQDDEDKPTQKVIGKPITRAQAAQMTYDAFQATLFKADSKPGHDTPFVDVRTTDPNFKAIVALARHNIAGGEMENNQPVFRPKESPSRFDLAQAMEKIIGELKPAGLEKLLSQEYSMPQDIPQSAPAYGAVEKMLKLHVLLPFTDGYFRGKRPTTDAEVAYALTRVKELAGGKPAPAKESAKSASAKPAN